MEQRYLRADFNFSLRFTYVLSPSRNAQVAGFASSIFCQALGVKTCAVRPASRPRVGRIFGVVPPAGDSEVVVEFLSVIWVGYMASEERTDEGGVSTDLGFL